MTDLNLVSVYALKPIFRNFDFCRCSRTHIVKRQIFRSETKKSNLTLSSYFQHFQVHKVLVMVANSKDYCRANKSDSGVIFCLQLLSEI